MVKHPLITSPHFTFACPQAKLSCNYPTIINSNTSQISTNSQLRSKVIPHSRLALDVLIQQANVILILKTEFTR